MIPAVVTDPSSGQPVVVSSLERQRVSLEKEINEACNEFLNEPDWNKNMAIVDQLNRAPYLCPFAMKAIRLQLKTKNPEIEILALQLTESIIKNCPSSHAAVAQEDFMRYLVKVGTDQRQGGKWTQLKTKMKKKNTSINSAHIRSQCIEKALLILKMLSMAYSDTNLYPVFRATVRQLEGQKVRFPETNKDESLTIFSPIHSGGPTAMGSVQNPNLPMIKPVVVLEDVHHYELVQAQEQAQLLFSMINAPVLSFDLIPDLTQMLNQSQQRIVVMISEGTADENVVMQALQVNDIVNQVLEDAQAIVNGTKRRYQEEVDVKKLMKRQDSDKDLDGKEDDDDEHSLEHSISLEQEDKDKDKELFALSGPNDKGTKKKAVAKKPARRKSEDLLGLNNDANQLKSAMNDDNDNKNKDESQENILDFLGVNNEEENENKPKVKPVVGNAQVVFDPLADDITTAVTQENNANEAPPKQEYNLGAKDAADPFQGLSDPFAGMSGDNFMADAEPKPTQKAQPAAKPKEEDIFAGIEIDNAPAAKPTQPVAKPKHELQNSDNVILDMFTGAAPPDPNEQKAAAAQTLPITQAKKKENPFTDSAETNPFDNSNNNGNATENKDNPFDALENPFTASMVDTTANNALVAKADDANPFANNNKKEEEEEFMGDRDPFADM